VRLEASRRLVAHGDALGQAGEPVELLAQRRRVRHMPQRLAPPRQLVELGNDVAQGFACVRRAGRAAGGAGREGCGPGRPRRRAGGGRADRRGRQAEPAGVLVELLAQCGQFDLALGQVLGGLDDGRALVRQPVDRVGLGEQRIIDAEGVEPGSCLGDLLVEALGFRVSARRASRAVRQRAGKSAATSGSVPRLLRSASRSSMRRRRGSACLSRPSRDSSARSVRCSCLSRFTASGGLVPAGVRLAHGLGVQALQAHPLAGFRMALAGLPEGRDATLRPGGKQLVGLRRQLARSAISDDRPGCSGKQGFADPAAAVDEPFGAIAQALAIEPEGIEEQAPVDAAEEPASASSGSGASSASSSVFWLPLRRRNAEAPAVLAGDRRRQGACPRSGAGNRTGCAPRCRRARRRGRRARSTCRPRWRHR
jgi:hypothetical protein